MNDERSNRFQSEQLKEVRRHLTDAEKQSLQRLMTRLAVLVLPLAAVGPLVVALHGVLRIVLLVVWAVAFLGSFIFVMSSLSKFYCSTDWGRQHGYSHKTFRFFSVPTKRT